MEAVRARGRGRGRQRERERERERERGVGHGRRGYAQDNISDDIRATLMRSCGQTQTDGRICNPTRAQLACFSVFTVVYFVFYFCITVFLRYCIYCTVKYSTVMCSIELMSFVTFQYFHFWLLWKPLLEKKQNKNCKCCIELHRMITDELNKKQWKLKTAVFYIKYTSVLLLIWKCIHMMQVCIILSSESHFDKGLLGFDSKVSIRHRCEWFISQCCVLCACV